MALNLQATIGLDGSGFESGLKRIEGGIHRVGETLKGLALSAVGFYGIERAIEGTIEKAEQLANTSMRLGVSVEALQELSFAAKQTGSDIEALTDFIEKLNANRVDPKKLGFFQQFGINNPASGDVGDIIHAISANVQGRNPQEFFGALKQIGGKGVGKDVLLLIENLEELAATAHKAGVIMQTEDIAMLKIASDELKILAQVLQAQLAPVLAAAAKEAIEFVNKRKSDVSFYKSFSKSKGLAVIWDELTSSSLLNKRSPDEIRAAFADIRKSFVASGAVSETKLEELDAISNRMIEALIERLKHPANPNFAPDNSEPLNSTRSGVYSDSLLKTGNFLGSISFTTELRSLGDRKIELLRQWAANTTRNN